MIKKARMIAVLLAAAVVLPLFSVFVHSDNSVDLALSSERFLSDFAISEGGNVSTDEAGNVVFDIDEALHTLKFKCTGASASGNQNAICLWLNNRTGSRTLYVDVVFMDMEGSQKSTSHIMDVENSGSDVYLFIPGEEDEFLVSISIKAAGVSEGSFSVIGMWYCYYYFADERNNEGIGNISKFEYANGGDKVFVEGSIHHDVLISSPDSSINVYRLLPGEVLNGRFVSENQPVAGSLISRNFSFEIKNKEGSDYAAAYAITVNNPDGSIQYIIEDKLYPHTENEEENAGDFKGVGTTLEYMPTDMAVSSLIIDVNIGDILSEKLSGYLYSFGGVNYCFKSSVVDEIQRRISSHTADSGSVYLRVHNSNEGSPFDSLAFDTEGDNAAKIYATLSFLAETYKENLSGIIIGNKFDVPYAYANSKDCNYGEYIEKYADYISVIRSAVKNRDPKIRVIIPVSSNNEYFEDGEFGSEIYPMFAMLISLLEAYSKQSSGMIGLMLSDSTFPYVEEILGNQNGGESILSKNEITKFTCENAAMFERLLDYLERRYSVTDREYFFSWRPYGIHEVNELRLAYIYNYLHLCNRERIVSFFCDFSSDEYKNDYSKAEALCETIAKMGSEEGKLYAGSMLFEECGLTFNGISGFDEYSAKGLTAVTLPVLFEGPKDFLGSAPVIDLSSIAGVTGWKNGVYSDAVSVVSVAGYGRAIKTSLTLPVHESEFADVIYDFKRTLNLKDVSAVGLKLIIDAPEEFESENRKITVKIAIGSESTKGVAEYEFEAVYGIPVDINLDTKEFSGKENVSYLRISVQSKYNVEEKLDLYVCEIKAYSDSLSSEELANVFLKSADINESDSGIMNEKQSDFKTAIILFFLFSSLSIAAVMAFKSSKDRE